jgi:hypothetical protein
LEDAPMLLYLIGSSHQQNFHKILVSFVLEENIINTFILLLNNIDFSLEEGIILIRNSEQT